MNCPYNHIFGKERGRYPDCDLCSDEIHNACEKASNIVLDACSACNACNGCSGCKKKSK